MKILFQCKLAAERRAATPLPPAVDGAKWIPLTRGRFALVDDADYERVGSHNWAAMVMPRTAYGVRGYSVGGGKSKTDLLHRVIMNAPDGMQVDHINGDGLDCRRANMRVCTLKKNHQNIRKPLSAKTSRFKGVSWMKEREQWVAGIYFDGKRHTLGYFKTEVDAAARYNTEAILRFGEFALLNNL